LDRGRLREGVHVRAVWMAHTPDVTWKRPPGLRTRTPSCSTRNGSRKCSNDASETTASNVPVEFRVVGDEARSPHRVRARL
jgi:hypothetical protein